MSDPSKIRLGHVTAPSGTVLLIDAGLLGMWSHDGEPVLDSDEWGETAAIANNAVELVARGRDADEAVRLFDRASGRPPYVFDVPQAALVQYQRDFADVARKHRLDARLEPVPRRVPHRTRVTELLRAMPGIVEVPY